MVSVFLSKTIQSFDSDDITTIREMAFTRYENQNGAQYDLTKRGWRYQILPFMERNGYRDASSWWIKQKPKNN